MVTITSSLACSLVNMYNFLMKLIEQCFIFNYHIISPTDASLIFKHRIIGIEY